VSEASEWRGRTVLDGRGRGADRGFEVAKKCFSAVDVVI
jgi:hypothetical protein